MIYIDADNGIALVNEKLIDLNTWTVIKDAPLLESMNADLYAQFAYLTEAATTIDGQEGYISQGVSWLLKQAGNVVKNLPYAKAFDVLKKFFPDSLEGWIHFGVDTLSLILDIIGPFTAGLGNAASMAIDVIHGIYYIGAGMNWPGFPNRSDRQWEYLLYGVITIGFALVPGGNVGTLAFRKFLQSNPITKGAIGPFLIKLFDSQLGNAVKKIFGFFGKSIGKIGKGLEFLISKLARIPFVGKLFEMLGLKKLSTKIIAGIDDVLLKVFKNPEVKAALKKQGVRATPQRVERMAAKANAAEDVVNKLSKGAKDLFAKGELSPAFKSVIKRLKMTLAGPRATANAVGMVYDKIVSYLSPEQKQATVEEVGMDTKSHEDWLIKYAYMLDEEEIADKKLSENEINKIQQYLIDNSAAYSKDYSVEKTGTITVQMMGAMRELFEFMAKPVEGLDGDEAQKAENFSNFCKQGIAELDKMDSSFLEKVSTFADDAKEVVKDKVSDAKETVKKVSESHVKSFKDFNP